MAYNRYRDGRAVRVETEIDRLPAASPLPPPEPERTPSPAPPPPPPGSPPPYRPGPFSGVLGRLETEDWLVIAILYLAYRSSGDWEMLAALGAYLFL